MAFKCMVCGELFSSEGEAVSHSVRSHPEHIYIVVENSEWSFQKLEVPVQTSISRGSRFNIKKILSVVASILT